MKNKENPNNLWQIRGYERRIEIISRCVNQRVFKIIIKLIGVCVCDAVNNFRVVRKQTLTDRRDEAFKEIDRQRENDCGVLLRAD